MSFVRSRNQVRDVLPAIQLPSDCIQHTPFMGAIPLHELAPHRGVDLVPHSLKPAPRGEHFIPGVLVFERHIELENLLQQLRWNVLRPLLPNIEPFLLQNVESPRYGVTQHPVRIVEYGRDLQCVRLFLRALTRKKIRMELAAQRIELFFEVFEIDFELPGHPEGFKIIRHAPYAVKEVPQPQLFFAFGFSKTNPDCISDSL